MSLNFDTSVNKTICGCDGGITIVTSGGYPPYQYSVDGGITYKNSPIFTNLCGGNYYAVVTDISGQTLGKYVSIQNPPDKITYFVNLNTTKTTLSKTNNSNTIQYTTTLSVTPELPNNMYVTFDVIRTSSINSSPTFSSATKTSNAVLTYNTSAITYSYSGQVTGQTFNTIPGCQENVLYTEVISEVWTNLTYSTGDEWNLTTTDTNFQNEEVICYIGDSQETFSVINLKIFGCNCCNVIQG